MESFLIFIGVVTGVILAAQICLKTMNWYMTNNLRKRNEKTSDRKENN